MSTLEDIKKRMDEAEEARRNYSGEDETEGNKLAYLAEMSSYDVPKLVAALEAVDAEIGELRKIFGRDDVVIRSIIPRIETAIAEALS